MSGHNMKEAKPEIVDFKKGHEDGEYIGTVKFSDKGHWKVKTNFTVNNAEKMADFDIDVVSGGPNWLVIGGFLGATALIIITAAISKKNKKDMALVYSVVPAIQAGTFTTNVVKAAPVKWDIKITKESEYAQAVILNSGVANACTGLEGDKNNELMAKTVAEALGIPVNAVYTASTGVIGKQMPMDVITGGAKALAAELKDGTEAGTQAAEAIMTTDTYSKECAVSFIVDGKEVIIGGMSKGSGMIHPNMATMLGVVTTDLAISKELAQEALSADVKRSFNMISVDRDTSTNDSLLLLANGLAGNKKITEKNEVYDNFCKALNTVTTELAKKIAADGEGASKLLETQELGRLPKQMR
jgi:glutamate N-acetyltransferase/amino-acid N-acetyltransferase